MHTSPLAQPGVGDGGGMNVYVKELTSALARLGVDCHIFVRKISENEPDKVYVEPGVVVYNIKAGPVGEFPKERLWELVPEFVDGVEKLLIELEAVGQKIDFIHANYWLSGLAGHVLKHAFDVPLFSTFHTLDRVKAQESIEEINAHESIRRQKAEASVIECSDVVLASSEVEREQLVDLYSTDRSKVLIAPLGIDRAYFTSGVKFQAKKAIGYDVNSNIVTFVGRIQPLKGLSIGIQAFHEVVQQIDANMIVIGGKSGVHGEEEFELSMQLIKDLDLTKRVQFIEPQPHHVLSTFYRASDVTLVPSHSESFGLVALESLACGTPVVASNVGGLTTLVEDGLTGFLIDSRETKNYANAILRILTNPELAEAMAHRAAEMASKYTWKETAVAILRVQEELMSKSLVMCS